MSPPNAQDGSPAEPDAVIPAKVAGRYAVRRLLGRGGFGEVYEAFDEIDERPVALKVIRRDVAAIDASEPASGDHAPSSRQGSRGSRAQPTSRALGHRRPVTRTFSAQDSPVGDDVAQAFKDEFRLLTQLHHPNLASVFDFGRDDGVEGLFFTQELVDGVELSEFLRAASRETIVETFIQLARALDYIHALGLVHGDIKPSNVLVARPDGDTVPQAKLIDFGLARMLRAPAPNADDGDPATITVVGTPGFSAPERVRGEPGDARADIYSLASTIYAATRGARAFSGKSFQEALRAQQDWRPELAGALLPTCGPVVAELIGRMLEPDPDRRPQSARAIVLELLRREATHLRDRQRSAADRRDFARVFAEQLPFVDRAHHLELLLGRAVEVLRPTSGGAGDSATSRSGSRRHPIRCVVVEAPEGMGKARLMAELRREIQLGDGLFVAANCWGSDATVLGPFATIVLQLASALGDASPAVAAFPELVKLARDGRRGRETAAETLVEFLIACSQERGYVIHLAELGQASDATRATFEQLSRAIDHAEARVLLCATTQPHAKVGATIRLLAKDQVAETWNLRPFNTREMWDVLQGMLGDSPVLRELSPLLDKLTGGHPLSFRETLRVLIEQGVLTRDADSWTLRAGSVAAEELHQSLAQRSMARLDALGVSAWEIASVLYLLEAPMDEDIVGELTDLRRERFQRTLDRLEAEGLVSRDASSGRGTVHLAHASVREAVRARYEGSLNETRLDLAERIDELEEEDPRFVYLQARLLDDAAEGLESADALEFAASRLFTAGQPQMGAALTERLILRLRRYGGLDGARRLLDTTLHLLQHGVGTLDDAHREAHHYEAGVLLAELLGDARAQALLWLGLADRVTASDQGNVGDVLARLDRASDAAAGARDTVLELRIANRRAEVLLGAGQIEPANRWSRRAMEITEVDDAPDIDVCHIMGVRIRCLALAGQLGQARRLHELAKPIAQRVPVVQRQSYLSGVAFLAVLGGDPDRGVPETRNAIEELRARNVPRLLMTPLHNLGDLQLRTDDIDGAEQSFREAIKLAQLYGIDHQVHLNRGFLGYTLARKGQVEAGADLLDEAKRGLAATDGEHIALQQLRLLDAEVAHMLGQSARARRELEEMLADFTTSSELSLAHWAQEALARIEGDAETAFLETPEPEIDGRTDPDQDTVRTKPVT
jgi:serine/threonine protein kinase/predicted transcriptional regulator